MAHSVSSRDSSKVEKQKGGVSLVTIGQQSCRLERLKKDGRKRDPPGWTVINDSEENIINDELHHGDRDAVPSIDAASSVASQQV
jgi:hypothetical protein